MRSGDIDWLKGLLKQYDEDGSALWLYTQALIAYRENGISNGTAEELARKAWKANNHVPAVLAGIKNARPSTNGYVMMGGEDEAAQCGGMGLRLANHARCGRLADDSCG